MRNPLANRFRITIDVGFNIGVCCSRCQEQHSDTGPPPSVPTGRASYGFQHLSVVVIEPDHLIMPEPFGEPVLPLIVPHGLVLTAEIAQADFGHRHRPRTHATSAATSRPSASTTAPTTHRSKTASIIAVAPHRRAAEARRPTSSIPRAPCAQTIRGRGRDRVARCGDRLRRAWRCARRRAR